VSDAAPAPHRPLAGVRVVDLSRHLPGPLLTRILADLGARVVKVEEPKLGDPVRHAPPSVAGRGSLATLLLAGHESLALDLKKEPARRVLLELLASADVLVESFRPGTLERVGLAPAELRGRFPELVICSVSGWGQTGPHAERAGHDLTYQAVAGTLAGGRGVPAVQVADVVGAWSGATAVLAALHRRERGGGGCWIDQALLDAAGHAGVTAWAAEAGGAKEVGEPLPLTGALPCYDLYPTRDDGLVAVAALEPKFWRRFCAAVGRKELALRQFAGDPETRRQVAELTRSKTRAEWAKLFAEHDLPGEPVLAAAEALAHPQVRDRGLIEPGDDRLPRLGYPALFDDVRPRSGGELPELGADTDRLIDELDLAPDLPRARRRAGGVGRRRSLKGWALRLVGRAVERWSGRRSP